MWDRYQYEVSVETGGREHTVVVYESAVPADLEPLLNQLNKLAGKRGETKSRIASASSRSLGVPVGFPGTPSGKFRSDLVRTLITVYIHLMWWMTSDRGGHCE